MISATARILSLCCVFPTRDEPGRGVFVRARLAALGKLTPVCVVAPVGVVRWGASGRGRFGGAHPRQGMEAGLPVYYPRWFYPPNAGWQNGILLFLQLLPLLASLRRREEWDILDAHFGHPEGVAAALLAAVFGRPFTVTLRGMELDQARSGMRRRLLGWALRRSERVFAVSGELRALAVGLGVSEEKALVSANGVDGTVFRRGGREEARRVLGVPGDVKVVLSAGSLTAVKGQLELLDAVAAVAARRPGLLLVIAGGAGRGASAYAREVRRRCEAGIEGCEITLLDEVRQDELVTWMQAADLFCLSSRREGCPNVVLEALACGLPVVATAVGAVPELIPSDTFGLTVPAGDAQALADAIAQGLEKKWDGEAIARWGAARSWGQVGKELALEFAKIRESFASERVAG